MKCWIYWLGSKDEERNRLHQLNRVIMMTIFGLHEYGGNWPQVHNTELKYWRHHTLLMLNKKHLSFQKLYLSNKRRESFGTVTASCCWMVEIHPFPQKILCLLPQAWRIIVLWGLRDSRMHHKVRASMSTINHCFIVGSHYFHQLGQSSTINPEWKSVYSWLWFHRHTAGQFAYITETPTVIFIFKQNYPWSLFTHNHIICKWLTLVKPLPDPPKWCLLKWSWCS